MPATYAKLRTGYSLGAVQGAIFAVALCQPRLQNRIASALPLGGIFAAPYSACPGNGSSSIFVKFTESEGHDDKRPRHSVDPTLRVDEPTQLSLIPAQPVVRLFATSLHAGSGPNASSPAALSRASDLFAVRRPSGASRSRRFSIFGE
jgi:hypothetical protein